MRGTSPLAIDDFVEIVWNTNICRFHQGSRADAVDPSLLAAEKQDQLRNAMHSISTRAPIASPLQPNALRAGR